MSPDMPMVVYDFACGKTAFCDESLSNYTFPMDNCVRCESCNCDESCVIYSDCCADVALRHRGSDNAVTYTPCRNVNPKTCPSQGTDDKQYYRVIDQCPPLYRLNDTIRQKCEMDNLTDYDVSLPVTSRSSNVTYKNKFCAECHRAVDAEQWTATLNCHDYRPMRGLLTQDEIWTAAMASESCCIDSMREPKHVSVRHCERLSGISTCPQKENATEVDKYLADMCHSFSSDVYVFRDGSVYRNIFCAACHNLPITRGYQCTGSISFVETTDSLSVLLNFNPRQKGNNIAPEARECTEPTCEYGEIFDPLLNRCRTVNCLPYKRFDNSSCVNTYRSMKGLSYHIRYLLVPSKTTTVPPEWLADSYSKRFTNSAANWNVVIMSEIATFGINISDRVLVKYMDVKIWMTSTIEVAEETFKAFTLYDVLRPWVDGDGVIYMSFYNDKCPINLTIPERMTNKEEINSSAQLTRLSPWIGSMEVPKDWLSSQCRTNCLPSTEGAVYLAGSLRNRCPYVSYNTSDIIVDRGAGILSRGEQHIKVEENEYEICGSEMYVCVATLRKRNGCRKNITLPYTAESGYGQRVASVVATTLSLFGLAVTLVTYCLFSDLRTRPGIYTMCLITHLFLAQLIFQATSRAAAHVFVLCVFFGILIHYLWLASFGWMAVVSYHMFSIFRTVQVIRERTGDSRKLFLYAAFANGTPILVIVACIAKNVAVTSRAYIGYGSGLCFLTNGIDVGIFMVAPVAVVIVINATFYGLTIHSIRTTTRRIDATLNRDRHHVGVYIKLSILLGFTWIFGLLAAALNVEALWYLFILTSGCQGFFIFVAYCCTRRVLSLYASLFCSRKDSVSSTDIPVTTDSTQL